MSPRFPKRASSRSRCCAAPTTSRCGGSRRLAVLRRDVAFDALGVELSAAARPSARGSVRACVRRSRAPARRRRTCRSRRPRPRRRRRSGRNPSRTPECPLRAATASSWPRVMPPRQYSPVEVHTSPLRTMKKCVELQVATKPCGSSISASSAPACVAWMQARMQLSLQCELSFGSCTAGSPRRTCTVNSLSPRSYTAGIGFLYSGMITIVAGADRHARVLVGRALHAARDHQPHVHAVAHAVRVERRVERARQLLAVRPTSSAMALAPSYSRSRWWSRNASLPRWTRRPSQTPSPSTKPRIEHRHDGFVARLQRAVDVDQDVALRGSETSCID